MRILQWWRCQFGGKTILVQVSALCIGNMSLVLIHGKKLPEISKLDICHFCEIWNDRKSERAFNSGWRKSLEQIFIEDIATYDQSLEYNDDPSPLMLNKTQEYEGLGCVSNGTLHTICAVGYIPPFHKIMHGTHILGKIFDQDNSR